jgi:ferredoxin
MINRAVPGLVQEIREYGRFDVNACLNCGSCTIVCELSSGHATFPRRPIQRALFGLKESLLGSLEPWLCHDCGDCATACPRQAEPRESMMTLRRYLAAQYDFTRFASKALTSRVVKIAALSITSLLVFALVFVYHLYYKEVPMSVSEFVSTPMGLDHMFPTIKYFTLVVFLIPALILLAGTFRMWWFTLRIQEELRIPIRFYITEAKTILVHMVSHKHIRKCVQEIHKKRWAKHWLLGLACTLMFVIKFFFLDWFQTDAIYPIYHPQRWLGYVATAILIYIPLDILVSRIKKGVEIHKFSELSDLTLPIMLFFVAITGIAVHVFRYLEFSLTSHLTYAVHLAIAVPLLVIELPFGKLSHVIYRPLALYFQAVKERALAEEKPLVEPSCGPEPSSDGPIPKETVTA